MTSTRLTTPSAPLTTAPLWTPSRERIENSNMLGFMQQASEYAQNNTGNSIKTYSELHQWSIEQPEAFWSLVWQYSGITPALPQDLPPSEILNSQGHFSTAQWFPKQTLNFAENLLQRRDNKVALIACGEPELNNGQDRSISYRELYSQVAKLAASLKKMGVEN